MTRKGGFTLIELLVAATLVLVFLAAAGAYFATEARVTRTVQARQEAEDKVRTAAQLLRQDLLLAGSSRYVDGNTIVELTGWTDCSVLACVTASPGAVATLFDGVALRYITSLRPKTEACREVQYRVSGDVLERGEAACGGTLMFAALAQDVLAADIRYVCSTGVRGDAPNCGTDAYARAASVSLFVSSDMQITPDPEGPAFVTADGQMVECPAERVCAGVVFETAIPNLKDR